ncbi:rhotekin-2 [Microtus oregoni]|uniref:rhotekin-2 n=1 Tax=Microtus oregoni TaxID=111838 RepID=UPI001BB1C658|nr:rhotekin-2 [Microtus oregoni]
MEGRLLRSLPAQQDCSIREKIDLEIRMREGIWKLLSLSTKKDQVLRAVKNLMVCHARIEAYTAELQKLEEQIASQTGRRDVNCESKERRPCRGRLALSDIRIPLMWKDSDHFSNKERTQCYAIFCLFRMGAEVFDTDMVIVDQTVTDICFDNVTIFHEAGPDFRIKIDVYSCGAEDSSITNTPKKLAKKLKTSISKAAGRKISSMLQEENQEACLLASPVAGAKYHLLAHATLTLESVGDCFKTHNLSVHGNEDCSFWLPLYGNVCCRLVAQPACMAEDAFAGFLNEQQTVKGLVGWRRLYCALRGGKLHCFYGPEEIEAKVEPILVVSIDKETKIQAIEKDPRKVYHFSIVNTVAGRAMTHVFAADSLEDLQEWMGAFRQHFFDLSQWKHCCEELMKIEIMSPRKPPLFLTKEATSVYHDMSIDSPVKLESLTDIIQKKIGETNGQFLIGQDEESAPPPWAAVFDGNHEMVIQKKVVSPAGHPAPDGKRKKRRAPLPPTDQPPFSIKTQGDTDQPKDSRTQASISAASPSDPRLSSQMHSFQKPVAAPRKLPPARKNSSADGEHTDTKTSLEDKPVPAPRQKSIRDILDPRSWLQTQV